MEGNCHNFEMMTMAHSNRIRIWQVIKNHYTLVVESTLFPNIIIPTLFPDIATEMMIRVMVVAAL